MSVVFDFSASLNDALPLRPILLSVHWIKWKSGLLVDVICVLFLLYSQLRLSLASAVFDFNASLNDVAPASPISLPVDLLRVEMS